jgi:hypothetical protein
MSRAVLALLSMVRAGRQLRWLARILPLLAIPAPRPLHGLKAALSLSPSDDTAADCVAQPQVVGSAGVHSRPVCCERSS